MLMRIYFDTEFMEDGRTIELLSIGLVREDDCYFYAELAEADHSRANDWVRANVLPQLQGGVHVWRRTDLAAALVEFVSPRALLAPKPEFWGYYADYDWVALCQLYGTMMDLPDGWPMYCRDLKQWCDQLGNPRLPEQDEGEHHALADARWNKLAYDLLAEKAGS